MPFVLLYLVVEIVALVALGSWIGAGWTLLVLLVGSVLGLWLARRQGVRAVRALQEAMLHRRVAHAELTDGMLVAIGGLLLFVPGLVTDLAGLLLVLPPTRALVRRRLVRAAERRNPELKAARIRSDSTVVDGEVVDEQATGAAGSAPPPVIEGEIVDPADRSPCGGS
ncbi:FxsA family protein [Pseudonocardia asaccharolytica]|uniref:Membrane protein n=1 Tax=Pseudonocardia asaccharolytica DSM 44247 = NBRC 16224 TaxID=1123024 RepID=A0A511D9L5_9PSEU|nr:FxsA family protein [Pseudonocardia asaccharolytica]GEL19638.1 membrane protein [Pseudonocardia asaccharolytica DSM 44247 = NBRC 16224]